MSEAVARCEREGWCVVAGKEMLTSDDGWIPRKVYEAEAAGRM